MQVGIIVIILVLLPATLLASICTKKEYNKKKNKMINVKGCCNGYRHVYHPNSVICEPICHESCGNGTCVRPSTCSCDQGFENLDHVPSKRCVPFCTKGCTQGQCIAPDVCRCDDGFQLDELRGQCAPICPTGCPNGRCESPGNCSCSAGYSQAVDQSCAPICTDECAGDRFCAAPNTCSCFGGFIDAGKYCLSPTTDYERFSSEATTLPDCEYLDVERTECLIGFIKRWMIEISMGILVLLALTILVCLAKITLKQGKYNVADNEKERGLFIWNNQLSEIHTEF